LVGWLVRGGGAHLITSSPEGQKRKMNPPENKRKAHLTEQTRESSVRSATSNTSTESPLCGVRCFLFLVAFCLLFSLFPAAVLLSLWRRPHPSRRSPPPGQPTVGLEGRAPVFLFVLPLIHSDIHGEPKEISLFRMVHRSALRGRGGVGRRGGGEPRGSPSRSRSLSLSCY
jgi:hypothetical protein